MNNESPFLHKQTAKMALAIGCLLSPLLAQAQPHSLTATTTVASDYIADGVSASDSKPALQLGLDYEHDSGFYAGIWTSNIDYDDPDTPNLELDYSFGFKHGVTEGLELDAGVTYYSYYHMRDHDAWNYVEWYAGITALENTTLYYYYSDDDKVWDGIQRRFIAEHTQPLPQDFSLLLTAERLEYENSIAEDYSAYRIGIARSWYEMDFTLSYWDNTIHDGDSTTDDRFVLEISKEFDLL